MNLWKKFRHSNFIIRLTSWEYWPFGIVQFPLFIYWFWLSLRARSLLFFSASNPTIVLGGMLGESKFDVLKLIPDRYKPKTILIPASTTKEDVLKQLAENGFSFPVIFKPDLGERGFMVKKITSEAQLESYINTLKKDFLIQEFLDLPVELGVFYTRMPEEAAGYVNSVVVKDMLTVTGDGKSTLEELILDKPRAKLQWPKLKSAHADRLNVVLPSGEVFTLNAIGNHSLGTTFLDGEYLINDKLSATFDHISKQIDGFYFGRYDLRCASIEDLYEGKVKIMELNGCGAEPAHIYQPGFSLWEAFGILFTHWKNIFTISMQNHKRGVRFTSWNEGKAINRKFKEATRL
jgi:RimK-like ATP-grasp domain